MAVRQTLAEFRWPPFGAGRVLIMGSLVRRVWLPGLFDGEAPPPPEPPFPRPTPAEMLAGELERWLAGKAPWPAADLEMDRLPPFTRAVLLACRAIPTGETCSYADLAGKAGRPKATRAAGNVMARNPFPLLIPCHRVVPSAGGLGSYQGGTEMKGWLRDLELRSRAGTIQ